MTLTSPNCPVCFQTLLMEEKVKTVASVKSAKVEITFEPPWSQRTYGVQKPKLELRML